MNRIKILNLNRFLSSQIKNHCLQLKCTAIGTNHINQRNYSAQLPPNKIERRSNLLTNYEIKSFRRQYCVKSTNENDKIKSEWPDFGGELLSTPTLFLSIKNIFTVFFIQNLFDPDLKFKEFTSGSKQAFEVNTKYFSLSIFESEFI